MSDKRTMDRNITHRGAAILRNLKSLADEVNVSGMALYGIRPAHPLGISMKTIRSMAAEIEPDHALAAWLWRSGIHEARLLATIVDEPERVTVGQMDRWVRKVDSWDLCDQCCANLFEKTPFAWTRCVEWSMQESEFVKRSGFSLMARLALADKVATDARFLRLLKHIRRGANDERNLVKKAVNWALRQVGKRNATLHRHAVILSRELARRNNATSRWIGRDALRELMQPYVLARVRGKSLTRRAR